MRSRKFALQILSLAAILSMALAACGGAAPTQAPSSSLQVGIVLPTRDEPRWIQDETRFNDALSAAGYTAEILFSEGDSAKEKANVEVADHQRCSGDHHLPAGRLRRGSRR